MKMNANTALLCCVLVAAPSLYASHDDDKGKGGKRKDERRVERRVKVDDEHGRVEERVRIRHENGEERVRVERRVAVPANRIVIINNDVDRLESILATAQNATISFPQPTLTRVANEANALANRIFANTRRIRRSEAAATARELRAHVREMHAAAVRGDAAAVRTHAGLALSFAVRLDGLV